MPVSLVSRVEAKYDTLVVAFMLEEGMKIPALALPDVWFREPSV